MGFLSKLMVTFRRAASIIRAPIKRLIFITSTKLDSRPIIVLANTAAYRNLGDHAITIGEYAFIRRYFPQYQILEITSPQWHAMRGIDIPKYLKGCAAIFLHGGGYMGSLWEGSEEENSIDVIAKNSSCPCVYFPQTVYYSDDTSAQRLLKQRQEFYAEHQNVMFCMRDRRSYNFLNERFDIDSSKILLTPDIALIIQDPTPSQPREGITLCFRHDEEKISNDVALNNLVTLLRTKKLKFHRTDTVSETAFPLSQRKIKVYEKLNEFKKSQLVITDRLHAMIFCAITHTPCIAFNNINGKVEGVYEWIREYSFIRLSKPENVTSALIDEMLKSCQDDYLPSRALLDSAYSRMATEISNFTNLHIACRKSE